MTDDHALVLFSGGQDSATCLAWALDRYTHVETVGFAYGQRHAVELACRRPVRDGMASILGWAGRLGPDTCDAVGGQHRWKRFLRQWLLRAKYPAIMPGEAAEEQLLQRCQSAFIGLVLFGPGPERSAACCR